VPGRYNLLLTDGASIAATACGDTLVYRVRDGSVVVASESDDDEAGWVSVPDRTVLTASTVDVNISPLWT
jgi:glutamine amidotransferase